MGFHFNLAKTMQALAMLLHFHGKNEMSYLRMLKLLYIADRTCLQETGRPISGDQVVAMKHGPVLSGVYQLIKGEHKAFPAWSKFFHKTGYQIEMVDDPGNGQLSKYEIGLLRHLTEQYADRNEWDMVEMTHEFPEWKRNDPGNSSKPIPLDHILEAIGRSEDSEAIKQDAHDQEAFDRFFTECAP